MSSTDPYGTAQQPQAPYGQAPAGTQPYPGAPGPTRERLHPIQEAQHWAGTASATSLSSLHGCSPSFSAFLASTGSIWAKSVPDILKLVTFGGLGIWALIDLILLLTNKTRDKQGLPLEGYDKHKKVALIVTGVVILLSIIFNASRGEAAPTSGQAVSTVDDSAVAPSTAAPEVTATQDPAAAKAEADAAARRLRRGQGQG